MYGMHIYCCSVSLFMIPMYCICTQCAHLPKLTNCKYHTWLCFVEILDVNFDVYIVVMYETTPNCKGAGALSGFRPLLPLPPTKLAQ